MIIDGHVHIGTSSYFHMQADADLLVRQADAAGFDRLFVTDLNALFYDMSEGNDALAKELDRHPDRLSHRRWWRRRRSKSRRMHNPCRCLKGRLHPGKRRQSRQERWRQHPLRRQCRKGRPPRLGHPRRRRVIVAPRLPDRSNTRACAR